MHPELTVAAARAAEHLSRLKQQTGFEMTANQGTWLILILIAIGLIAAVVTGLRSS